MVEKVDIPSVSTGPSLDEEAAAQDAAKAAAAGTDNPALAGETAAPERPEWLPEKFATVEDMAKAYAELEKARSKGETTEAQAAETDEAVTEAVDKAGLDMDALSAEWAEKGELTPESLDALSKVGITKAMVDSYIAGQEAQQAAIRNSLLEPVGGEEAYNDMVKWAADNLTDTEIEAYNAVLEAGDMNATKMAVENLKAKFTSANGSEPQRQLNGKPSGTTLSVYESTADLMKDMGNPEYRTNPAFRAKVEAKLGRSNIM